MDKDSLPKQPPSSMSARELQSLSHSKLVPPAKALPSPAPVPTEADETFSERDTTAKSDSPAESNLQTPTNLSVSARGGSESILSRPRPGSSPFFGRPTIPTRTSSGGFSRRDSRGSSLATGSPVQSTDSPHLVVTKDSRSVSSSACSQERPRLLAAARSASASEGSGPTPRKVIRPDNWWQTGSLPISQAPNLPEKSPLRAFLSELPPCPPPTRPSKHFPRGSELEDLLEQEALRLELSPPPLRVSKGSTESPTSPKDFEIPQKTLAPPEAQARLEEPNEVSPAARELLVKKVLSKEFFTELTKLDLAEKVEEAEDSLKRKHRKMTLEVLEGSPISPEYKELIELGFPFRSESDVIVPKMDSLHPESAAALTAHRREAIRLAKSQERAVAERCKRSNQEAPGYTFDELIGKGSFGRVYKGYVCFLFYFPSADCKQPSDRNIENRGNQSA